MQNIIIRKMQARDFLAWDSYVDKHGQGSFFHLTGWYHVICTVFGHQPHYLLAEESASGKLVGVLPLFAQKSVLFGHALVSIPFCVYGGVLANSAEIKKALEKQAYQLGLFLGVDYIELRDRYEDELEAPWVRHCQHATFSAPLAATAEDILSKIKRKQRAVVRQALANELSISAGDPVKNCYDIYAESVRNLGTPVFSEKLFTELKKVFKAQCETLIVKDKKGKTLSSVLSFYYKDRVLPYYGGGSELARALKSNDFMYYQLMCLAREKGFSHFDFGRSKIGSGAYCYKKHWGMDEEKLHYKIALVKAKQLPNFSPNNPKYKLFIKLWKKIPVAITRQIGPVLSKYLG